MASPVGPLPERSGAEENQVSDEQTIVDWVHFERSRSELGP
jgi:hypothetical protein